MVVPSPALMALCAKLAPGRKVTSMFLMASADAVPVAVVTVLLEESDLESLAAVADECSVVLVEKEAP